MPISAKKAVENLAKKLSFTVLAPCKSVVRSYYQNANKMLYFNQIVEIKDIPGKLVFKGENNVSLKFYSKNANAEIEIEKASFCKSRPWLCEGYCLRSCEIRLLATELEFEN